MNHGNTAIELKNRGDWAKIAKKHYQNIDGVEVFHDCNNGWNIKEGDKISTHYFTTLWAAVYEVDHKTYGRWF